MDNLLSYIPFSSSLSEEEGKEVLNNIKSLSFKKGEKVNPAGECSGFIIIHSGQLKVYSLSEDGREITLFRLFERDLCIFTASCLLKDIDFSVNILSEEDSECVLIPTFIVDKIRRKNIGVSSYICSVLSAHLSDLMWLIDQILNKRLDSRLAAYLCEEADLKGTYSLKITHEEAAHHLGSRREVITRTLSYLEKEGEVELRRGEIEIRDIERLSLRAKESLR